MDVRRMREGLRGGMHAQRRDVLAGLHGVMDFGSEPSSEMLMAPDERPTDR